MTNASDLTTLILSLIDLVPGAFSKPPGFLLVSFETLFIIDFIDLINCVINVMTGAA